MAKIVELESGTDPVEEVTDPKQKAKNETEEMIQRLMKKAYVLGLSAGMKTMCGSILEKMNQNKNLNHQKQLMLLRQWCNHNLAINNQQDENNDTESKSEETTNNTDKKENENDA